MRINRSEKASVFIAALILLAALSVVIMALASEVSLDTNITDNLSQASQARELARVGIEKMIYAINNNSAWRTAYPNGVWFANQPLGGGSFTASGTDSDSSISDCPIDDITATSTGTLGEASQTISATLRPNSHESALFLAYAIPPDNKIDIRNAPSIYGDMCAGKTIEYRDGLPVIVGNFYLPAARTVSAALADADTAIITLDHPTTAPPGAFNWFISRAATITPPLIDGSYVVRSAVISTTRNPYGFANAEGIYYINGGGKEVRFTKCYINATIIVTNATKVVFKEASVHSPAFPYYPTLMSDSDIMYEFDKNLSESACWTDFNGDGDLSDTFTPTVTGVVYTPNKIHGLQNTGGTNLVRFKGVMIGKEIRLIGAGCIFEQDAALASTLVNQFHSYTVQLLPQSLKSQ